MAQDILCGKAEGSVYVLGKCVFSGKEYATAEFPRDALNTWREGAYIQDGTPHAFGW